MENEHIYTSDSWRFTGDRNALPMGLHASCLLSIPTGFVCLMIFQFAGLSLFWPFVIFWLLYVIGSGLGSKLGFTPTEVLNRFIISKLWRGRYKVPD
jgi:hypothetical protein